MPATTYTYDAENKLIAICGNGTSVLYEYISYQGTTATFSVTSDYNNENA